MPNYRWEAIDLEGREHTGVQWAPSIAQLERDLLEQQLGLMGATRIKLSWFERWSLDEQVQFFEQLYLLQSAGLLVGPSLQVLARYGSKIRQSFAAELSQAVKHGSSLADALAQFPSLIDPLTRCLVTSGQESGNLPEALGHLVNFLRMRQDIRKKIYAAARVPLVTLAFFCAIVLIIFLAIIPSFEQILTVTNQAGDNSLSKLFVISRAINSLGLIGLSLLAASALGLGYLVSKSSPVRKIIQWFLTHVPGISGIYWSYEFAGYFQAVALLVRGGKGLVDALQLSLDVLNNRYIVGRLSVLIALVNEGHALDQAYAQTCASVAKPDITPLLAVGDQTGMLANVLEQSSRLFFDYAQRQLNRLTLIIQPILMGILGLLITLLLYTVYVPIIQLPQTLGSLAA